MYICILFHMQSNSPPLICRTTKLCIKLYIGKERTSGGTLVLVWVCLHPIWSPFGNIIRTLENVSVQCCWSGSKAVLTAILTLSWVLSNQILWIYTTCAQKSRKPSLPFLSKVMIGKDQLNIGTVIRHSLDLVKGSCTRRVIPYIISRYTSV